jgi:cytoskeletal protein CcmA (bactofilin family)
MSARPNVLPHARLAAMLALGALLASTPAQPANLYLAGPEVHVAQPADGDVVAAAGRLDVDGAIAGDAVLAAGSLDVRAPVGDDLRAAGGIITLGSTVSGETLGAGASIHVTPKAELRGRTWLAGNEVVIAGRVTGEVKAYGRYITVSGELTGPVQLSAERIELQPTARVNGDLAYSSTHRIVIRNGAVVTGRLTREAGVFEIPRPHFRIPGLGALRPLLLLGLFAFGLLLYAVFPRYTISATRTLQTAPLKSLGLGAALFFSAPPVMLLLVITIIGIPVALVLGALYAVAVLAGYLIAAFFIGIRLARLAGRSIERPAWRLIALAVALTVLWLLRQIPYAGGIVGLLALLFGLGALALQAFTQYSDRT